MRYSNQGWFRRQFGFLRRQILQDGELPLSNVLSEATMTTALDAVDFPWKDRIYTPLVTLWVFLGQDISADQSCRAAVARLIAHRVAKGFSACSSKTGAYCQTRMRLPEKFFATIARAVGREVEDQAEEKWLWKGRRVYMFDGTTVLMPDTAENRQACPPTWNRKVNVGLPLARIAAVFSLSCGVILYLATARYAGKGQGEVMLLRQLAKMFSPGDILLADSLTCNWRNFFELAERGVHAVTRLNIALRTANSRRGERLSKDDHVVRWPKPRIREVGRSAPRAMPRYLTIREVRVYIKQPRFRTKAVVVATTLLDPIQHPKEDLADRYRERWNNELGLRSIKSDMQMECLRGKTPELVRKEIWTHVLAYNLIRTFLAQAAIRYEVLPRTISFKGTLQILEAFQIVIALHASRTSSALPQLYETMLEAIVAHRVADRPDRFEPRRIKRRHKHYVPLFVPRAEATLQMLKGFTKH